MILEFPSTNQGDNKYYNKLMMEVKMMPKASEFQFKIVHSLYWAHKTQTKSLSLWLIQDDVR